MITKDSLYRGTAFGEEFRVFAVDSTQTVLAARKLHDLSPLATILMGKMISAAALMSMELKVPRSDVTLKVEGHGALTGAFIICTMEGKIRGYANEPHLFFEETKQNLEPGKHLGAGTLTVMHQYPGKQAQLGSVELISGEIAEDLAQYYLLSEQIPTAVNIGLLIDKQAFVRASGGFIIQQMPDASPKNADLLIRNLANTPNISDLMDMGFTIPDILKKFVFKDASVRLTESHKLVYRCDCSRTKFSRALLLLGKTDLTTMREGITPVCKYCNKEYHFSAGDISALLEKLG
ncbi:MAG: Hsp33 family molecular chaperone HslO [Candidatus Cloacimonadaceae bacterium]|nr:Hsp33 family molecular chaperone HslO [Candidatus Cloacimonadaceae bacterium]MDP3113722.1 Hsp33 family molecular chaperone HslO [Candidatus Cloacimonadaceae bacterium]